MAGLGVILHHLASATPAFDVELEEDGGTVAGYADAVVFDEGFDGGGWQDGAQEGDEMGVAVGAHGAFDVGDGDGAEGFGLRGGETPGQAGGDGIGPPGMTVIGGFTAALLRMISEVLLRGRSGIAKQPQGDKM